MPFGPDGKSRGFALIDFETKEQAAKAVAQTNGWRLDAKHIFAVRPYAEVSRLLDMDKSYTALTSKPHAVRPDPNHWLLDPSSRDQFALRHGTETEIFWTDTEGDCAPDYCGEREKACCGVCGCGGTCQGASFRRVVQVELGKGSVT